MKPMGVLGISKDEEFLIRALEQLQRQGYRNMTTFSPIPSERLSEWPDSRKSPIRAYTLVGGILGLISGLSLTILTSLQWPLLTGGKPIVSIPPFLIIAFELTILFGGLSTLLGLGIHARLFRAGLETIPEPGYDVRFAVDRFGIFVPCEGGQIEEVKRLLLGAGVEEVSIETP
ncbi:MAG: DUF3341 domain-containing protein [Acidobacteria bacterium]|nr:DUF3341 domain-containing protein [Acidobacteriota bacterium]